MPVRRALNTRALAFLDPARVIALTHLPCFVLEEFGDVGGALALAEQLAVAELVPVR